MKRISSILVILFTCALSFAGEHYAIRHYSVEDGLSQNTVMAILQDKQGFMWFGTWDGLNRFDGYEFTVYKATGEEGQMGVNNRIDHLYEDSTETLWWSTYDAQYYCMGPERGRIEHVSRTSVPSAFFQEIDQQSESIRMDANGILWRATEEPGISRLRDGQWKTLATHPDPRFAGQLQKHFILLQDHQGRTWVNPTGGGFGYYDAENDCLRFPCKGVTNMIHTAYFDRNGLLWLSTYDRGVECISLEPQPYCLHPTPSDNHSGEVRAFAEDNKGEIHSFVRDSHQIYTARQTSYGLILGTKGQGLTDARYRSIFPGVHMSSQNVYDILEGPDSTLYIATYGGGINIISHPTDAIPLTQIVGNGLRVRDIILAGDTLWAATTSGLYFVNLSDRTEPVGQLIGGGDVRTLYYNNHRLWLGTFGSGLCYLETDHPEQPIHTISGSSAIILSMAGAGDTIWYTNEKGITEYNLQSGSYTYYDVLEGTNDYFTEAEALRTSKGQILFGYNAGYCVFTPGAQVQEFDAPRLLITAIESNDQQLVNLSPIHINPEDGVTIHYAALEFNGPNKIRYAYRLDSEPWHHVQDLRRVSFSHLSPGKHQLTIRSTNRYGIWTDNDISLAIHVSTPFWQSWIAGLLYLFIIAIIIVIYRLVRRNQTALKEEMAVEQKVTEIKLRFFTNISHELRTPLTLITGPIENILRSEHLSPAARQQLEIVQSNSQRMLRLINQLLDFRKIQNKKMRLKVQRTLMSSLVEEVTANFNKEAYDKHIRLLVENKATDTTVWVDRERMDTILYNLLSNAFKFTPAGKTIRVILSEKPGYLVLSVRDEGIGIPKERRGLLFERFSSHDDAISTPDKPGTGIGLNLVKELVDLHRGLIEVQSEEGVGTTFNILLHRGKEHFNGEADILLQDDPEVVHTELKQLDKQLQHVSERKEQRTLLVVDDNEDMRRFLITLFSSDYEVMDASDGKQALAAISSHEPDLIISDVMMPNMDGLELLAALKSSLATCHIPIILLTAKSAIEDRLKGISEGADDYIGKPFDSNYLRVRIQNIIQQREQLEASYRDRLMRLEPKKVEEEAPNDKFLMKLLEFMEQQMDNSELTVEQLVEHAGMGRTVFFNRLKKVTGLSPVEFIREIRIKRAAQLLESGTYNVSEVTYMVGMNDSRYFSKCFKNTYGMTPSEYKRTHEKK